MVAHRQNMTIDPIVYEEFCKYAGKKGCPFQCKKIKT